MMKEHVTYLGLGSNLGDRKGNLEKALELLEARGIYTKKLSAVIETEPMGGPAQPRFLNAVARTVTCLGPFRLLDAAKAVEKSLGREDTGERWGPRPIDIDILLYDDITMVTDRLVIPHPRMALRGFVLEPLAEVLE